MYSPIEVLETLFVTKEMVRSDTNQWVLKQFDRGESSVVIQGSNKSIEVCMGARVGYRSDCDRDPYSE